MSFSKEVLTCARYAKGGSGKVVFVAVGGLRPDWLHDYATTEGAARLRAAAASPAAGARAERFALADLEVRYDGSVPREAVTWVADLSDCTKTPCHRQSIRRRKLEFRLFQAHNEHQDKW